MAAIYQADVWCDDCANVIRATLNAQGRRPDGADDERNYDSDEYPKWAHDNEESDSPTHCAADADCINAETLSDGTKAGALFGTLTFDGVQYVRAALLDGSGSKAVLELWAEYFADYDLDVQLCPHCKNWIDKA